MAVETTLEATRRRAEYALRAMHHYSVEHPIQEIASLIHPDAEMRLLVSYGKPVRGRRQVLEALAHGREAATFKAEVLSFDWLDDTTSLTAAFARYPLERGGIAEGRIYWLDELRDGLIWRVAVFKREEDARRAYAQRGDDA